MKTKRTDMILCALFCGFLFTMMALYFLLPSKDFSDKEKRYLAEAPKVSMEKIQSGTLDEEIETYLADHVPGRDFFVGVNANYDLYSGRQVTKDIYLAKENYLLEKPYIANEENINKNMAKINAFAETVGQPVDLMIVPTAGYFLEDSVLGVHDSYNDDVIISQIYGKAGNNVNCRDLMSSFAKEKNQASLYYRTDHHWTSLGAYKAYCAYMEMLGKDYLPESEFTVESHQGFLGTTYSRSGLWQIPAEPIELWKTDTAFTVTIGNQTYDSLFFPEKLEARDKYEVFLNGNNAVVTIHNPDTVGKGHLLVFRDSYANCLGTFLANSYETVTLVDLRYCQDPRNPVSKMVLEGEYTDILVCYSLGNFLTDENFAWLR